MADIKIHVSAEILEIGSVEQTFQGENFCCNPRFPCWIRDMAQLASGDAEEEEPLFTISSFARFILRVLSCQVSDRLGNFLANDR